MKLSFIPILNITSRIGCTDARSAEKRCIEMGIKVHKINTRKYVIEEDINREMEMRYIEELKQKYPNKYREIYLANKNDDYLAVHELISTEDNSSNNESNTGYKPQSLIATNFLRNLQK